jgi:hypothetical protein
MQQIIKEIFESNNFIDENENFLSEKDLQFNLARMLERAKTPSENAIARLYYALYEYSIGNKKLGMGQIENESNKILKYGSDFDGENSTELVNLVFDLCR